MTPHNDRTQAGKAASYPWMKPVLAGICGVTILVLQACTTADMPQPKYPIYMQDRPAEAPPSEAAAPVSQSEAKSSEDRPTVPPPSMRSAPLGDVQSSDLPPPPPPPSEDSLRTAKQTPSVKAAPMAASAVVAAPAHEPRAAFVYVLQAHDTLYGVSRRFGVPVKALYELNGLSPEASLRIGQKISLPAIASDKGAEVHANGAGLVKLAEAPSKPASVTTTTTTATPLPVKPSIKPSVKPPVVATTTTTTTTATTVPTPVTKPAATKPAVSTTQSQPVQPATTSGFPTNAQISQMGKGLFIWPLKGKVLVPFGQLAPNVRNDGINIASVADADIKAAADGVVVYEGDQVKALGNTVYIKHDNGWYTGYSHMASMTVKNNERVKKGQVIGTVGQTGVIDQPQLHFEVRYTPSTDIARPVDPRLILP